MTDQITMKDLAAMLGISVSTVARALADHPGIGDATKARVRELAGRHGYVAHSGARAMRLGHSQLIGLIVPDLRNDFYAAAAMALARLCDEAGFQLVLAVTRDDPDSELRQVRGLIEARAAGVVIALSPDPARETPGLLARVATVELIREGSGRGLPWFGIDDHRGIEAATAHLVQRGHRRIGYLGGPASLSTGRQRLAGYHAALAGAGIAPDPCLIRLGTPDASFAGMALGDLWSAQPRPTALVSAGAGLTVGALDAIGRLGISVPAELSVVGFGDAPWFRWWGPGLTTMGLPIHDLALACGSYLLRRIAERAARPGAAEEPPYRAIHAPTLILRGSTADA